MGDGSCWWAEERACDMWAKTEGEMSWRKKKFKDFFEDKLFEKKLLINLRYDGLSFEINWKLIM